MSGSLAAARVIMIRVAYAATKAMVIPSHELLPKAMFGEIFSMCIYHPVCKNA